MVNKVEYIVREDVRNKALTRKLCCRKDDRAMRPIYGYHEYSGLPDYAHDYYSQHFYGLLFRSTLWIFLQNLKSVAFPVPGIIGGTKKIWAVPGYAHAPLSPKFLMGFIRIGPVNVPAKFEVRSFTCSWDNIGGTQKIWAVPGYAQAPFPPKF